MPELPVIQNSNCLQHYNLGRDALPTTCFPRHCVSFLGARVRSPPPLPTIFLIGRDLAKTRGGKRGQIHSLAFLRISRVTAGFLGTWVSQPTDRAIHVSLLKM